jgi:hypothetical protein
MHKELRKYSSIGNKSGILLLCHKVLSGHQAQIASIRTTCSFVNGCDINLRCGLLALEELGLVEVVGNICTPTLSLFENSSESDSIEQLCQVCFSYLMESNLVHIDRLKYNEQADLFYIPKSAFSLQCSIFRNLLITLGALIPCDSEFRIAKSYDLFFQKLISDIHRKLTLEELKQKLEKQEEIGEKGELFVLQFEKQRCNFSNLAKSKIRQISHVDVSAGYDIISFEDETCSSHRYIEVKTYIGNPHFYWSANEIDSAKIRGASYCIYLVDFEKIESPNYKPEIICNPYSSIRDSSEWKSTPSSFLVEKICTNRN